MGASKNGITNMPKTFELGTIEKIPEGQGHCYLVAGKEIAVFRTRNGQLHALDNRCPHRQGPLADGVCDAERVLCPYHAHPFDLKTGRGAEAGEQVTVYEVWQCDGKIFLNINES